MGWFTGEALSSMSPALSLPIPDVDSWPFGVTALYEVTSQAVVSHAWGQQIATPSLLLCRSLQKSTHFKKRAPHEGKSPKYS